jgi:hypothetical protein
MLNEEEIISAMMEAALVGADIEGVTKFWVKRRRRNKSIIKKRENK